MSHEFGVEPEQQVVTTTYFDGENLAESTSIGKVGLESALKAVIETIASPQVDNINRSIFNALDSSPEYQEVTAQLASLSKHKHTKRERLERRQTALGRQITTTVLKDTTLWPEILTVKAEPL